MAKTNTKYPVPQMVAGKAKTVGEIGLHWLAELDDLVDMLAAKWQLRLGPVLHGGSHALVCSAEKADGVACVLKIEIPDLSEREYLYGIEALRIADGSGYARLYAVDTEHRACLLEALGAPLRTLAYSVETQIRIICDALKKTWAMPVGSAVLQDGGGSLDWFAAYIPQAWNALDKPCPTAVIDRALDALTKRKAARNPAEYVLLHGDAHNNNTLQVPGQPDTFKLIDSEGIFYEKAYDLGVLMREWPEMYRADPSAAWRARADLLHTLTGVDTEGILQWGYLQMTATALILLQAGENGLGMEMLELAAKIQ